ncbi:MAG TPA: glycosyltransferase family 9 protein, partial [Methylomirabilota bacterium]|nr:glycosyltransferase family 9 protein [Methylomirabilota bacterium]
VGFARRASREPLAALFASHHVQPPAAARHVVDRYLALLAPLGVTERRLEFALPAVPASEAAMDEWLAAQGLKPQRRLVVLNPGAGRSDKRWPVEHFAALAARLTQEAAAHVVVVWGPGEAAAARAIVAGSASAGPRALLAPPTDLHELLALLRRASLMVAADTGPLHLAAALGTPCVGLYGPTSPERNGPYGPGHRTLTAPGAALAALTPARVLAAVAEALA